MSPDDPRHGSTAGFHAGCRCDRCRAARARYEKESRLIRLRGGRSVPALGSQRRIQALMRLGWTSEEIATAAGWHERNYVLRILSGQKGKPCTWVERGTAAKIAAAYDALSMTLPPENRYRRRNRNTAEAKGYAPPLAWDDIDNDPAPRGERCQEDGCDRERTRRGWCEMHYRRFMRGGTPEGTGKTGRPRGEATYDAVHRRLRTDRGVARDQVCPCGSPAATWSYDHSDHCEMFDDRGRPFSPDLSRYQALCVPCHNRRDHLAAAERRVAATDALDDVAIDRRIAGDRVPLTTAEKAEARRRWVAAGRPLNELERVTGINTHRRYEEAS